MVITICSFCGKEIKKPPSQIHKNNFCSNKCRYMFNRKEDTIFFEKDYAYILLNKNNITKKILFDLEDVEKIKHYKWHLHYRKKDNRYDVCSNSHGSHKSRKYIIMSRFLLNYDGDLTIDHINRNTLDNRKKNLRIVSVFENNLNKGNNTSGCVGVCWDKTRNKWHVMFKNKNIGRFINYEDAVNARKNAEKNYFQFLPQNNF